LVLPTPSHEQRERYPSIPANSNVYCHIRKPILMPWEVCARCPATPARDAQDGHIALHSVRGAWLNCPAAAAPAQALPGSTRISALRSDLLVISIARMARRGCIVHVR
jgi:hypothetical protein